MRQIWAGMKRWGRGAPRHCQLEHFKYKCSRMLFGLGERDRLGRTRRRLAGETFYGCILV